MKHLIWAVLVFASYSAQAGCNATGCHGIGKEVITSVYNTAIADGRVYLQAPATKQNLDCSLAEGQYMTLRSSHPLFKEIYSTILMALSSNKRFHVRIQNGSSGCTVSYVRLYVDQ